MLIISIVIVVLIIYFIATQSPEAIEQRKQKDFKTLAEAYKRWPRTCEKKFGSFHTSLEWTPEKLHDIASQLESHADDFQRLENIAEEEFLKIQKQFSDHQKDYEDLRKSILKDNPIKSEKYISISNKPIARSCKNELLLFFDTEATGLPKDYNAPSSDVNNWPRLVQLSWIVTDIDGNHIKEENHIIYPQDFEIPSASSEIHGITTAKAKNEGESIEVVLGRFITDFNKVSIIVGHNIQFDKRILGSELIRLHHKDIMDSKSSICTMKSSTNFCALPGSYYGSYKYPKLQELYVILFGSEFSDAHNALSDVRATERCFWELIRRNVIKI